MSSTSSGSAAVHTTEDGTVTYLPSEADRYHILLLQERAAHAATRLLLAKSALEVALMNAERAEAEVERRQADITAYFRWQFAPEVDRGVYTFPETFEITEGECSIPLQRKV
jgi:hypothetical protein